MFIGRTDAEAETPILWPPDAKSQLIGKDLDVGKDQRQEEKGTTEDEMAGWHHWHDEHEFVLAQGVDGQGELASCSPWGHKESDTTEQLNWLADQTPLKNTDAYNVRKVSTFHFQSGMEIEGLLTFLKLIKVQVS